MYQAILVPLDGSDRAEWALPAAINLARAAHARVCLLTIEVPVPLVAVAAGSTPDAEPQPRRASDYLNQVAQTLNDRGIETIALGLVQPTALRPGTVGSEIARRAEETGAGLIVMTTHARGNIARMVLGSVARDTVHASTVPVLLIKPPDIDQPPAFELPPLRHILMALDTSPFSEEIVNYAIELGRPYQAQFTIVTAVQPTHVTGIPVDPATLPIDGYALAEQKRAALKYQDEIIARMRLRGLSVTGTVVTTDAVAAGIAAVAYDVGPDVIALTTHARSGARTFVLGSVAQQLMRELAIPVLMYRPRD